MVAKGGSPRTTTSTAGRAKQCSRVARRLAHAWRIGTQPASHGIAAEPGRLRAAVRLNGAAECHRTAALHRRMPVRSGIGTSTQRSVRSRSTLRYRRTGFSPCSGIVPGLRCASGRAATQRHSDVPKSTDQSCMRDRGIMRSSRWCRMPAAAFVRTRAAMCWQQVDSSDLPTPMQHERGVRTVRRTTSHTSLC